MSFSEEHFCLHKHCAAFNLGLHCLTKTHLGVYSIYSHVGGGGGGGGSVNLTTLFPGQALPNG